MPFGSLSPQDPNAGQAPAGNNNIDIQALMKMLQQGNPQGQPGQPQQPPAPLVQKPNVSPDVQAAQGLMKALGGKGLTPQGMLSGLGMF